MDFDGESVIAVCDSKAVLLAAPGDGRLSAFRADYAATYDDEDPGDSEHVFTVLPTPLLIPVRGADVIARIPVGTRGRPVQLAVLTLDEMPDPPTSPSDDYAAEYQALGPTRRVLLDDVLREINSGAIIDLETLTILYSILYASRAPER